MHPAIKYFFCELWRTCTLRRPAACDSRGPNFWIRRDVCLCAFKSIANEAYGNTHDCSGTHTIDWIHRTAVRYDSED